jgi:hypothetical protein
MARWQLKQPQCTASVLTCTLNLEKSLGKVVAKDLEKVLAKALEKDR